MWIFPVGNDLDKHKTGSMVPTLSKPCLPLLDFCQTYQLALKWKNCGRSYLYSPVTPSSSHAANTTVLATTQILFTDLQLLRHSWRLGLQSLHLSGWFKNIHSQNAEYGYLQNPVSSQNKTLISLCADRSHHSMILECTGEIFWSFCSNTLHYSWVTSC